MTITYYQDPTIQTNAYHRQCYGYRQKPITPKPLGYRVIDRRRTKVTIARSDGFCSAASSAAGFYVGNVGSDAASAQSNNMAYAKFRQKMLEQPSQLGNTLGEYQQAIGMMTARVGQLTKSVKLIRKGKFGEALKELGVLDKAWYYRDGKTSHFVHFNQLKTDESGRHFFERKTKSRGGRKRFYVKRADDKLSPRVFYSKDFANTWLELHFGWVPLCKDISDGLNVMVSVPPMGRISVYASNSDNSESRTTGFRGQPVYNSMRAFTGTRMGALVMVSNPNLYRANQLGIVNPFSVMWELTPWSFLVDWFINIGDCIGAMSDLFGVKLVDPYTTRYRVAVSHEEDGWGEKNCEYSCFGVNRFTSISGPTLKIRPFKLWGWKRLATAMSLLIQQIR